MKQPVNKDYQYNGEQTKIFTMIDNYIYLYHTDTLIAIPTYPETISDAMRINYSTTTPLSRSAPIYSFVNSGPRSFAVSLSLHRDMMNDINVASSNLKISNLDDQDYVDIMIKQLNAAVLPRYAAAEKMVNPPIVAVRFGKDIFCKGVITDGLTTTYAGPILRTDKYAQVNIEFAISEIDPYDADTVMNVGHFRGLNTTLERRIWKTSGGGGSSGTIFGGGVSGAASKFAAVSIK